MSVTLKSFLRSLLPRTYKAHTIVTGPLRGMKIVTSWRDYPAAILGYGEEALTRWLLENAKRGETWLDVGAHYGYTSLALGRSVGAEGRVYAFEPSLASAGCLARTRATNALWTWTVCPFALNRSPIMHTQELPIWRGMIDSQLSGGHADGTERFFAIGLDGIWDSLAGGKQEIHGIKIDVQGMELDVLEGAASTLRKFTPKLVIEVHTSISRTRLKQLLAEAGYGVIPVPIEADAPPFEDENGNASYLFTRR